MDHIEKSIFYRILCLLLAGVCLSGTVITHGFASALDQKYRSFYATNDIMFYNPNEQDNSNEGCGSDVTIIGDSITYYAANAIKKLLPGAYVDSIKGTNWSTDSPNGSSGISRLQALISSGSARKNIVFALGGNNDNRDGPLLTVEDINLLHSIIGPDHNIFLITDHDILNPDIYTNNNNIKRQAEAEGWAHIIDWGATVSDSLIYHEDDPDGTYGAGKGVHPNPAGQSAWAELVYTSLAPFLTSCEGNSSGSPCLTGNTAEEIIWSGLLSVGFTAIQAASIMGNMQSESNFNPVRRENNRRDNDIDIFTDSSKNYGVGLIQWSFGRRINFLNYMLSINPNFKNYFLDYQTYSTGSTQSGNGFLEAVGRDIYVDLVKHSLDFLWQEISTNSSYSGFFNNSSTIEQGTEWFLARIESPENPDLAHHPERLTQAQAIYNNFANKSFSDDCADTGGSVTEDGWLSSFPGFIKESPSELGISLSEAEKTSYTTGKPNKILLHSTEGTNTGIGAYPSNNMFPAHFTIDLKSKSVSQHFSINQPSLSIKSYDADGPIQIEIVGFSTSNHSDSPKYLGNYTNEDWDYLARLLQAISQSTGIPLTSSVNWEPGAQRLSASEFSSYQGILGHMHAPANDHTDPGNFWAQISGAINRL